MTRVLAAFLDWLLPGAGRRRKPVLESKPEPVRTLITAATIPANLRAPEPEYAETDPPLVRRFILDYYAHTEDAA